MRVLVVTAPLPWDLQNGASLVLHHHLRILSGRHSISVIGSGAPERERSIVGDGRRLPSGVTMRWFGTRIPAPADYFVRRVRSALSGEPAHVHWVERPGLVAAFRDSLGTRPDIVHLHGWGTAQLARFAETTPVVHVPLDAWSLGGANRALPRWRSLIERSQPGRIIEHERRNYPRCSAIVVVADSDAQQIRRLAPAVRVEIVPNGVEPGPEPPVRPLDAVLGFHGSFENRANADAALMLAKEVLPLVRRQRPETRLVLVGRDPPPQIAALAEPGIDVRGSVPDIREALSDVSVYVAPMISGTGLKNKVLEAMAMALPVVATPSAIDGIAAPEIVVAQTRDEIANRVVSLLGDGETRRRLGREGRARVISTFSWERSASAIEALWKELVP